MVTPASPPLLVHVFPTFAVGGAQIRFAAIANRFGRAWRHLVVALDGVTECRARLAPELDVTFADAGLRKGDLFGNLWAIRRFMRANPPAVLVTSNWGSIEWALANLAPLARHIHMEDGFGPEERARQLARRVWTRRLALMRSDVVLPSRTLLRIATDQWRLHPSRLHYIPNGVDLARYTAAPARAGDVPVIGIVAALRSEKNIGRLLRAFARLRQPARLVVVGDGIERGALETLAASLGIAQAVRFTGHLAEPQHVYREFDVFALSSDTEQMPLSVLEAMAAGLAIAATDVGDVRAMVSRENADFIVAADDDALARALSALLDNGTLRQRIGRANRAKAEAEFEQEIMFQAYAALIDPRASRKNTGGLEQEPNDGRDHGPYHP